nr:roadblock/LC7 domain-containing protein [Candidatus Njordarchaeum guaymaensis]
MVETGLSLKERLARILKELTTSTQGIDGTLLVRPDGLIVSSWIPSLPDGSVAAAMSAALLNIGANVMKQLELGELKRVVVSGGTGDIVLVKAGEDMILSAVTRRGTSLGMAFLELGRTSERISRALSERK